MSSTQIDVFAKINLSLNIAGFENNRHVVQTIMCKVGIKDNVFVKLRSDKNIVVKFENSNQLDSVDNTAYKMAQILQNEFGLCGFDISIKKGIPIKGGLGGSSADASGVLRCIDKLCKLQLSMHQTYQIANKVGADVAFLCSDDTFAFQDDSKKSIVALHSKLPKLNLIILSMGNGVSTKESFASFGNFFEDRQCNPSDNLELCKAITTGNVNLLTVNINNALLLPSCSINPRIMDSLNLLKENGAIAVNMTGSGSACFGIFEHSVDTQKIVQKISHMWQREQRDVASFLANTYVQYL